MQDRFDAIAIGVAHERGEVSVAVIVGTKCWCVVRHEPLPFEGFDFRAGHPEVLYALGEEQLYRLYRYMVKDQCKRKRGTSTKNFKEAVAWLNTQKLFPQDLPLKWLAKYEIRNIVSHPTDQQIATPADSIRALREDQELALHFYSDLAPASPAAD